MALMHSWVPHEQPFLCEKGDAKKLNTFFKDFKLYMPLPDYATMQLVWKTCASPPSPPTPFPLSFYLYAFSLSPDTYARAGGATCIRCHCCAGKGGGRERDRESVCGRLPVWAPLA